MRERERQSRREKGRGDERGGQSERQGLAPAVSPAEGGSRRDGGDHALGRRPAEAARRPGDCRAPARGLDGQQGLPVVRQLQGIRAGVGLRQVLVRPPLTPLSRSLARSLARALQLLSLSSSLSLSLARTCGRRWRTRRCSARPIATNGISTRSASAPAAGRRPTPVRKASSRRLPAAGMSSSTRQSVRRSTPDALSSRSSDTRKSLRSWKSPTSASA
jgi:hypothetical protein